MAESGEMQKTQTTLDSTLQSVDKAEAIVVTAAEDAGFDEDDQHQIGMAVRECVVNAVVHGNRYSKNKKVHLTIEPLADGLSLLIGDEGTGFDLDSLPDPLAAENLLRQSGRGLLLMRAFMDEFDLHPRPGGGSEVRLVKKLTKK
jgi:serine/threonine-protein kinase RsbW